MSLSKKTAERIDELSRGSGTEDLVEFFGNLPEETDRNWELQLTELVRSAPERIDDIKGIIDAEISGTEHSQEDIKFAALFTYFTYHRHHENYDILNSLLRRHESFESHPMFPHLQALYQKRRNTPDSHQKAIDYGREAVQRVGTTHPGVTNSLATAILYPLEEDKEELLDDRRIDLLDEAERNIQRAIDQSSYPKFKATYGRILAMRGQYDDGINKIREAINDEDASQENYALRIGEYRKHEFRVFLEKYAEEIRNEQEEIRDTQAELDDELDRAIEQLESVRDDSESRLRDLQAQTLQFLGFFATLLAVIISSIQIATSFTVTEAAGLILVLVGGLLIAFGGFSIILPVDEENKDSKTIVSIGAVITTLSLLYVLLI